MPDVLKFPERKVDPRPELARLFALLLVGRIGKAEYRRRVAAVR